MDNGRKFDHCSFLQAVLGSFQATFLLVEATFLRDLMVGIASINGSNYSLGREIFFSGQGVNFS